MSYTYNFPEHKDARTISNQDGLKKIFEEVLELRDAICGHESDFRVIEESLDAIHAHETNILRKYPQEMVDSVAEFVIEKNRRRGYYDKKGN